MKVMGPAQTFTGPFPVVIRFLAPVIGGGAAATAAVLGDGRGLVDHSGEKDYGGMLDLFQGLLGLPGASASFWKIS